MGFNWNQFYSMFKARMKKTTVGRYKIPKDQDYPYTDIALSDSPGADYTLRNEESAQEPMITIQTYCNNYNDALCYEIMQDAKNLMLEYGFRCIYGPAKIDNVDGTVARWVARYRRVFASGDALRKIKRGE